MDLSAPAGVTPSQPGHWLSRSVVVVGAGQPGRQPVDRDLEIRVQVHEDPEAFGQPLEADLLLAAALDEFLDSAIGEVHVRPLPGATQTAASILGFYN